MDRSSSYIYEESIFRKKLFSPMKSAGFVPEKDSEIFVSNIPHTATVYDLFEFFKRAGVLFQVKLMTKSDGLSNRGFAYVTYMNKQLAKKAMYILKDIPFMKSAYLSMQQSVDNCRIFLGGIPITRSKDEIWHELKNVYKVTNIVDVITYRNYANPTHNRGFVFLEFRTHEDASYFRAKYWDKLYLFGKRLLVDWSIPTFELDGQRLAEVKILFVRNLDVVQTSDQFAYYIYKLMDRKHIEKVYKFKDYAYIHLTTRENAERLMEKLKQFYRGTLVEVLFAKPPNKFTGRSFREKALISRRFFGRHQSENSLSDIEETSYQRSPAAPPSPSSFSSYDSSPVLPSTSYDSAKVSGSPVLPLSSCDSSTPFSSPSSSFGSPPSFYDTPSSSKTSTLMTQLSYNTWQCVAAEKALRDLMDKRLVLKNQLTIAPGVDSRNCSTPTNMPIASAFNQLNTISIPNSYHIPQVESSPSLITPTDSSYNHIPIPKSNHIPLAQASASTSFTMTLPEARQQASGTQDSPYGFFDVEDMINKLLED